MSLQEKSAIYYERADVYDRLSAVEDADGLAFDWLLPHVRDRRVLDLGCGTGKYLRLFAPHARHITGIDAAAAQLAVARRRVAEFSNIDLIHGDAADVPLPACDAVIACWMLGTILDEKRREKVLAHAEQALTPGGQIFLVENDACGVFEEIRGRTTVSAAYHAWLQRAGFSPAARLATRFRFDSGEEAQAVLGAIWGESVAQQVRGPEIPHSIVIFERRKKQLVSSF